MRGHMWLNKVASVLGPLHYASNTEQFLNGFGDCNQHRAIFYLKVFRWLCSNLWLCVWNLTLLINLILQNIYIYHFSFPNEDLLNNSHFCESVLNIYTQWRNILVILYTFFILFKTHFIIFNSLFSAIFKPSFK